MNNPHFNIGDLGRGRPGRGEGVWHRLKRTVVLATVLTLPVAVWGTAGQQPQPALAASNDVVVAESRVVGAGQDSYAPVVDAVAPAVVTIRAEQRTGVSDRQRVPFDDPFFREFFGNRLPRGVEPQERLQRGLGSGVIVRPDGYILTNHHVVDGADRITVELTDRRTFTAKVVGSDAPSDLAVLKVEASALPTVPLANSDDVRVGDVVLAVGNPLGVGQTVTQGIVSAKGRATGLGDGSFEDFLQTDAPINRGNSGGALVSTRGQLVGINSQILSPSGGSIGIGFAIPANMAKNVMESLIADGRVHRGMLGVTVQPVTPEIASSVGLASPRGALISSVQDGGPADVAGLERGDVVTAIDGRSVDGSNDLRNRIAAVKPGNAVKLTVFRDGKERTIAATLKELPAAQRSAGVEEAEEQTSGTLGLGVEPLPRDRARALGITPGEGLIVASVAPSSAASDAGFRPGDVIEEVNGTAVDDAGDLRRAVSAAGTRPVLVLVRRDEQPLYLTLAPRS